MLCQAAEKLNTAINRIIILSALVSFILILSCSGDTVDPIIPEITQYADSTQFTVTADCIITVKAWGAGGQGGGNYATGGGGGYSRSVFSAKAGDVIHIVIGVGGGNAPDLSKPALGGQGVQNYGGGGSLVALYRDGVYTLKCSAGGGGGGGNGEFGGAGGGVSGCPDTTDIGTHRSTGGSKGAGGLGYSPPTGNGFAMTLTSASLIGFNGNGADSLINCGGGGGGGYGGGATGSDAGACYGGSGGGGYCEGSGSGTVAGSGDMPGNADDDLPPGYALGGAGLAGANGLPGGDGYVIIFISYK